MDVTDRLLKELHDVLKLFETAKSTSDLRQRVRSLLPAFETIRKLGKALVPQGLKLSARNRILAYFLAYPRTILDEKELALVAGISEWARRVRELRIEHGWKIITGMTAKQMLSEDEIAPDDLEIEALSPNNYVLLETTQDREAAYRWNVANEIRKSPGGSRDKILHYLQENVGKPVTGEELSYVAKSSEWARRTRELRTEEGWPITTKMSGNPTLSVGVYVLEMDRQAPAHDRRIPENMRRSAMRRDNYECKQCGWSHNEWNPSDPRYLELHHLVHHASGGANTMENLMTYCNVCHDEVHKVDDKG